MFGNEANPTESARTTLLVDTGAILCLAQAHAKLPIATCNGERSISALDILHVLADD